MSTPVVVELGDHPGEDPGTTSTVTPAGWGGSWVADRLGVQLGTTYSAFGPGLTDLVGLAVRRNPRRAHLLVSAVLGKHVPTDPRLVYGSGALLGLLVADSLASDNPHPAVWRDARFGASLQGALAGDADAAATLLSLVTPSVGLEAVTPPGTVVVGFAETATALGHAVADVLAAPYLHSTRRPVPGFTSFGSFEEEHSHATSHLLLPADPGLLTTGGPLVLVDDELSTGQTVRNTITALHAVAPRARYVIAALVDLRSAQDRDGLAAVAADLGVQIDVVSLAAGAVDLPSNVLAVGQSLVAAREAADATRDDTASSSPRESSPRPAMTLPAMTLSAVTLPAMTLPAMTLPAMTLPAMTLPAMIWPPGVPEGARHGFLPADRSALVEVMAATASDLARSFVGDQVLVLGHEELMYAPLRLALGLVDRVPAATRVRFSTTTRSPILAVDDPSYAVRTKLTFPAYDDPGDGPGERYAYNVAAGDTPSRRFTDIVMVIDVPADTPALRGPDGLLSALGTACDRVHLVILPSYIPAGMPTSADDHR